MKDIQEFKDWLRIEYMEEHTQYGHFPFQLFFEDHEGKKTMGALLLGDATSCYKVFHKVMKDGAVRCYMSVDFPGKEGHIENDYIAVFSFNGKNMDLVAIPYVKETGERLPEIHFRDNETLRQIMQDFSIINLIEAGLIKE